MKVIWLLVANLSLILNGLSSTILFSLIISIYLPRYPVNIYCSDIDNNFSIECLFNNYSIIIFISFKFDCLLKCLNYLYLYILDV